ncbi:MAG TPA: CRISPR-associated endonuclease Cas1 [Vicinamibacterales bacterium]
MLNEFVYCPRLFFYEWVEKLFAHSADTVEGALRHQELDKREDALPPAGELAPDERIHARSVTLSSDGLGLIARLDLVEGEGGQVSPVDYKRGAPRDGDDGPEAWPADRVQACAQALLLREHGYQCSSATVYYSTTRQRVQVPLDEALLAETAAAIRSAWQVALAGRIPPPLVDSAKCPRCSLVGICLPDETRRAMLWMPAPDETPRQLALFDEIEEDRAATLPLDGTADPVEVRRLVPARDDLRPLYVAGYGLSIAKSGDVLQVRDRKGVVQEARLSEISQVNTFGSVTVTGGALQALCFAGKPVAHFSFGGWFSGLTQGLGLKNIFLRRDQFRRADDVAFCLRTSAGFVATKIRNQRVLLQRNHIEPPAAVLSRMKALAGEALRCGSLEELLGIEGQAARLYFEHFAGMLKTDEGERMTFAFIHRNRRPPRDPVNALLSLAYSLLVKELTIICHAVGFDPFLGFYHQPRFGRPALALDLMEGFRPLLADSAVLTAINAGMVDGSDVVRIGEAVALTARGRKALIRAFEQRLDQLVTHPLFGYRVSYRRVLETQTRLLARTVMGEIPNYPGFETR